MAVNNKVAQDKPCSHWSLLVYCKSSCKYFHLDSIQGLNYAHAQSVAKTFNESLGFQDRLTFKEIACFLQMNGIDCGVHVIRNTSLVSDTMASGNSIGKNTLLL